MVRVEVLMGKPEKWSLLPLVISMPTATSAPLLALIQVIVGSGMPNVSQKYVTLYVSVVVMLSGVRVVLGGSEIQGCYSNTWQVHSMHRMNLHRTLYREGSEFLVSTSARKLVALQE